MKNDKFVDSSPTCNLSFFIIFHWSFVIFHLPVLPLCVSVAHDRWSFADASFKNLQTQFLVRDGVIPVILAAFHLGRCHQSYLVLAGFGGRLRFKVQLKCRIRGRFLLMLPRPPKPTLFPSTTLRCL